MRASRVGLAQAGRCEIAAKKLACAPRAGVCAWRGAERCAALQYKMDMSETWNCALRLTRRKTEGTQL